MSHQNHFNLIANCSNKENKIFMLKNIRGMNDPAFQSNKTLKQYINKKLTSYEEYESYKSSKGKTLLKFNENGNKKFLNNRNNKNVKKFAFTEYSFYSKSQINNLSHNNASLNNLRKIKEKIKERKRNNFYIFKCKSGNNKNKSTNKPITHKNKKGLNLEENKYDKYLNIVLTPNNNYNNKRDNKNNKNNKTTPINTLNKIRGIYKQKNIVLNKSYKSYSRDCTTLIKKGKEKAYKIPDNNCKNKLKKELYNIINKKPLNQTYFKDNSKKSRQNKDNLTGYFNSENNENTDKLRDVLLNEESLNESECPEPMPYVIKYSEIINKDKENISNSTMNILNNFNKNISDLKEPKEEKNIPFPVSQISGRNNKLGNKNKKIIYMNRNKFIKKEI